MTIGVGVFERHIVGEVISLAELIVRIIIFALLLRAFLLNDLIINATLFHLLFLDLAPLGSPLLLTLGLVVHGISMECDWKAQDGSDHGLQVDHSDEGEV